MKVINSFLLIALVSFGCNWINPRAVKDKQIQELEGQLAVYKNKEEAALRLGQYTLNMMVRSGSGRTLSEARKIVLAQDVVRVAMDIFPDKEEHRKAFVAVVAIESGFDRLAQSPTGPKGLGQLAKAAFKDGSSYCALPHSNDTDVWETTINLYSSACYFRSLLEANNNDPLIAIVAYNQGGNSASMKSYSKKRGHE